MTQPWGKAELRISSIAFDTVSILQGEDDSIFNIWGRSDNKSQKENKHDPACYNTSAATQLPWIFANALKRPTTYFSY